MRKMGLTFEDKDFKVLEKRKEEMKSKNWEQFILELEEKSRGK